MVFSEAQQAQFKRDGFFCSPGFFTPDEVEALQGEIARLQNLGLLRNVATAGDGATPSQTQKNLQLCPTYPHSPLFRALPFSPKVVRAIQALIGDPIRIRLDQVFLKPAKDGMGTSWHQDNAYFGLPDPMKGVAMWIAVHDANLANGAMHMIPGLQLERLEHTRDPFSDHHVRCWPDETREVPCELAAGGVVFFAYGTPHCTKGNHTERDRAGLAYHFFNAESAGEVECPWAMPYLTGPLARGGEEEYGEDQRGGWEQMTRAKARS